MPAIHIEGYALIFERYNFLYDLFLYRISSSISRKKYKNDNQ